MAAAQPRDEPTEPESHRSPQLGLPAALATATQSDPTEAKHSNPTQAGSNSNAQLQQTLALEHAGSGHGR